MRSPVTPTPRRIATTLLLAALVASVLATTGGSASASAASSSRAPQGLAPSLVARKAAKAVKTPTASNTGVPRGTKLRVRKGNLKITKSGTVIKGLDIRGFVDVRASNVTIKNSIIRGRKISKNKRASLVSAYGNHRNLVIKDSTLRASYPSMYLDGLKGRNFTALRLDISRVVDTALIFGGSKTIITRSWLHGNTHYSRGVKGQRDGKTHDDNIQVEGGKGIRITYNRISGSDNAAVMVTQNYSRINGLTVGRNLLSGGACTINTGEKGKGAIRGMRLISNRFGASKKYGKTCPMLLPRSSKISLKGNVWNTGRKAARARFN